VLHEGVIRVPAERALLRLLLLLLRAIDVVETCNTVASTDSELVDPEAVLVEMVKEMKAALGTHYTEMQNNYEYKLEMQRILHQKRKKEQQALLSAKRLAMQKREAEEEECRKRSEIQRKHHDHV